METLQEDRVTQTASSGDAQDDDPWSEPIVSPAVWTRRWGNGKVFVCTPGHQLADLETPAIRTVIGRGLLWAAR